MQSTKSNDIVSFSGEYRYLSNFWICNIVLPTRIGVITFASSEHAYQAFKAKSDEDFKRIAFAKSPGETKRLGRIIDMRDDWEEIKLSVMTNIVQQKFKQNRDLMDLLLSTKGRKLVEGNTWGDTFWGESPIGTGRNELGKILMSIRDDIYNVIES